MSTVRTKAIVLRRTNFGEADRIIQCITPSGKVSALARGVRREKSKLAGGIELLAICDITLRSGKGELHTLTSARLESFFSHILEDYDKLQFAYYVLKDVGRVAEQLSEPDLFTICDIALRSLNNMAINVAVTELWYKIQMAALLGVGVNTARDGNGMKLVEDARYRFDITDMAFVFDQSGEYTSEHIKVLRVTEQYTPEVIAHIQGIGELISTCLGVARATRE